MRTRRSPRNQQRLYGQISRQLSREEAKSRLFIGCFPEGLGYADQTIEEHGDYKNLAFLSYRTLELTVYAPRSPLLPLIREDAAAMQARRGQPFQVSQCGQTITLGWGIPPKTGESK